MKTSTLAEPTFVGRTNELSELMRFLDSMLKGEGSTVFISGEAGSGKTRLSKEFLEAAKNRGVTVLTGWCLSNAAVPYFPFIEAFSSLNDSNQQLEGVFGGQDRIRTTLFGENTFAESNSNQILNPSVWKDQLFAAITKELLLLSTGKPTILFIDDIHWADSASLALLHYIARAVPSEKILILTTFRCEEIVGSVDGKLHPLVELLRLMGRESLYDEIKLANLSLSEVGLIGEIMLGGFLSKDFVELLSDESRGNALFVVESLRLMFSQGSLIRDKGYWQLLNSKIDFPQKVRDVILRRIDTLKPNQKRILDVASVIGEKFNPRLIGYALSERNMDVLEALSNIAQSTLLVYCEDNFYRFKHAKIQEMIYAKIDPLLKKEYHLRIADCLEANNMEPPSLSDISHHYAMAGISKKTIKYALAAGKDALARWSNVEAIKHFSYVLQISGDQCVNERENALEGLGDAYYASCMFEDSIQVYDKLSMSETPIIRLRALRKEMDTIWFQERVSDRLVDLLKKAEPLAAVDRLESARVRWNNGRTHVWGGPEQLKEALTDHEEALRVFEEEYSLLDTARILWPVGLVRIWVGLQEDRGLGEMLQGIAMLHELGDIHGEMLAYQMGAVDWFCFCGLFEEGYSFLTNIKQLSENIGDFDSLSFAWLRLSDIPTIERDFSLAISHCLKALDFSKKSDTKGTLCRIFARLIQLYVLKGNLKKAKEYLDELSQLPKEIQQMPVNYVHVLWAEAFFLASTNYLEQAIQKLEHGNEILSKTFSKEIGVNFWKKSTHSLFLELLGKTEEATLLMQEVKKITEVGEKKFENVNVTASLMAFAHPKVGETFEIRLDLVNVSRTQGMIVKIDNLVIPELEIVTFPSNCLATSGSIQLTEKTISPFQVKTIKLSARIPKAGTYTLEPTIVYASDLEKKCSCKLRPIVIAAQPILPIEKIELEVELDKLAFASEPSKKAFNYLMKVYNEDCLLRLLSQEQSGWRSLMQIVKEGHVTKHSMYGQRGIGGQTFIELKRLKLIEVRFSEGEPGRGGKVKKVRISPSHLRASLNDHTKS